MDRLWRRLLALFTYRRRRPIVWTIEFVPTDVPKVDADLGVSKRAKEQGEAGFPSITDTEPDFVHRLVYNHFHQQVAYLHTEVQALAHHCDSQFTQIGVERIPEQIRSVPDRFQQLADGALVGYQSRLDELRERRDNAKAAYDDFKRKYGLIADADYPESKFVHFSVPFGLLAVEALFNAYVFSGADPMGRGIAGGIRIALIIALINIVIAVLLGNSLRNLNSRDRFKQLLGWISALAAILYIPLNLFWAHYRDRAIALKNLDAFSFDELVKLRMQVLPDAWAHFIGNPLAITSIESWGLFVLGCFVVVIALSDGYKMSDRIPGFEDRHRALLKAQRALGRLHDECVSLLNESYRRISAELQIAEASYNGLLANYDSVLGAQERLETVYKNQGRDYVQSYETVVALYRAENNRYRAGQSAPAYFNQPPTRLEVPRFPADLQERYQRRKEFRSYASQITTEVTAATEALQSRWTAALRSIGVGSHGVTNAV